MSTITLSRVASHSESEVENLTLYLDRLVKTLATLWSRTPELIVSKVERTLEETLEIHGRVEGPGESDKLTKVISGESGFEDIVCFDSSSRSIGFTSFRITITGIATLTPQGPIVNPTPTTKPLLAVKSYRRILEEIEREGLDIKVKSVVGEYYTEDYKDDNIGDELRLELENKTLEGVEGVGAEILIIDGPVYPTPPIILRDPENKYAKAYTNLIKNRNHILGKIGYPVVGFVKRCEYSRKLYKCEEVVEFIREHYGKPPGEYSDPLIVETICRIIVKNTSRVQPILLGPFKISYDVDFMPSKIYWYTWIPTIRGSMIYRIETLEGQVEKYGLEFYEGRIIPCLVGYSSTRGIPVPIEIVDRLARRITASIYLDLASRSRGLIPLLYDEIGKVEEVQREIELLDLER